MSDAVVALENILRMAEAEVCLGSKLDAVAEVADDIRELAIDAAARQRS